MTHPDQKISDFDLLGIIGLWSTHQISESRARTMSGIGKNAFDRRTQRLIEQEAVEFGPDEDRDLCSNFELFQDKIGYAPPYFNHSTKEMTKEVIPPADEEYITELCEYVRSNITNDEILELLKLHRKLAVKFQNIVLGFE